MFVGGSWLDAGTGSGDRVQVGDRNSFGVLLPPSLFAPHIPPERRESVPARPRLLALKQTTAGVRHVQFITEEHVCSAAAAAAAAIMSLSYK